MRRSRFPSRILLIITTIVMVALTVFFLKKSPSAASTLRHVPSVLTGRGDLQSTLAIIKPDAINAHHTGEIIRLIELNKFAVQHMQKIQLTREQAQAFYAVHKERPFFGELVEYMISGQVVVMALEKDDAVQAWRDLMGATNPAQAAPGTMRRMFGTDITHNATHGSDSPENAAVEIKFFFQ